MDKFSEMFPVILASFTIGLHVGGALVQYWRSKDKPAATPLQVELSLIGKALQNPLITDHYKAELNSRAILLESLIKNENI